LIACEFGVKVLSRECAREHPHSRSTVATVKSDSGLNKAAYSFAVDQDSGFIDRYGDTKPAQTFQRGMAILTGRIVCQD
jgi:hypothetical protein